jgi:hypothetical protein
VVTCPRCKLARREPAKFVRYRIKIGRFTGLCLADAARIRSEKANKPEHPAINWDSLQMKGAGARVAVTCPVCGEARWVLAKSVRKQLAMGQFTGACMADRFNVRGPMESWPEAEGVDWNDFEMVPDSGGRRRRMIRIHCPKCGAIRRAHPSHLAEAIRRHSFRPECPKHRVDPALSARARAELLQLVRIVDVTIGELAQLKRALSAPGNSRVNAS